MFHIHSQINLKPKLNAYGKKACIHPTLPDNIKKPSANKISKKKIKAIYCILYYTLRNSCISRWKWDRFDTNRSSVAYFCSVFLQLLVLSQHTGLEYWLCKISVICQLFVYQALNIHTSHYCLLHVQSLGGLILTLLHMLKNWTDLVTWLKLKVTCGLIVTKFCVCI